MRRPQIMDPTAGERAREIRAHPADPQRITDPTDPRYGELLLADPRPSEADDLRSHGPGMRRPGRSRPTFVRGKSTTN